MQRIFEEATFNRELLYCDKCGWRGRGAEVVIGEFLFMTDATEIFCPSCEAYMGFINGTVENEDEQTHGRDSGR